MALRYMAKFKRETGPKLADLGPKLTHFDATTYCSISFGNRLTDKEDCKRLNKLYLRTVPRCACRCLSGDGPQIGDFFSGRPCHGGVSRPLPTGRTETVRQDSAKIRAHGPRSKTRENTANSPCFYRLAIDSPPKCQNSTRLWPATGHAKPPCFYTLPT